jgi:uncharacterized lipoprotein YajG
MAEKKTVPTARAYSRGRLPIAIACGTAVLLLAGCQGTQSAATTPSQAAQQVCADLNGGQSVSQIVGPNFQTASFVAQNTVASSIEADVLVDCSSQYDAVKSWFDQQMGTG